MKISHLPLVRTSVFEPFVTAAGQIGVPIEKTLRHVGLPESLPESSAFIPELPAWKFVHWVSQKEGISDFGLIVASLLPHQELATVKPLITGCMNLHDLLKRFCEIAPLQTNTGHYKLVISGDTVRFVKSGFRLIEDDIQVQMFEVLGMIELVQAATGADWRPNEIQFTFGHLAEAESAPVLNPSRILYSQPAPAIGFPRYLLALPLPLVNTSVKSNSDRKNLSSIPETFSKRLREAITPYLGTRLLNKRFVSEIAGLSSRSLQRTLDRQNTSYSEILNQARLQKAQSLLKETDEKLIDISLMLGYENASAFSRAFRCWSGVSPREFRKINTL